MADHDPNASGPTRDAPIETLQGARETGFRDLFEYAAIGMALVDPDGRLRLVNQAVCDLLGYSNDELLGMTFVDICHADDVPLGRQKMAEALRPNVNAVQFEARGRHKRGDTIWIHWAICFVRDVERRSEYFIAQSQDISERKRVEGALRDSEERFRKFVEHAADAIFVHRGDGRFVDVNRAACDMLGYERDQLLAMCPWDFVTVEPREKMEERWHGMRPGVPVMVESVLRRKDGSTLQASVRLGLFEAAGERLIIATCRDVTSSKASEEALRRENVQRRQAEELARAQTSALAQTLDALATDPHLETFLQHLLRAIALQFESKGTCMWLLDADRMTLAPHMYCEKGQIQMVSPSERLARSFRIDEDPQLRELPDLRRPFVHDIANAPHIRPETREYLLSEGVTTALSIPVTLKGELLGVLVVHGIGPTTFREEHVRLGQALAQQASLAIELTRLAAQAQQTAVMEERTRLARDIHDTLAQAFTGVVMQLEAAKRALPVEAPEAVHHVERAIALARDGLAEARRSVWTLRPGGLDARDLPEALRVLGERVSNTTGRAVRVQVKGDPRLVAMDAGDALVRVAQEAVTNAVRHAGPTEIIVELTYGATQVAVTIRDAGLGFDASSRTEGFGLVSMRERIERVGGGVRVISASGQGTTVIATLPNGLRHDEQGTDGPTDDSDPHRG